jgi:hypothetical protein
MALNGFLATIVWLLHVAFIAWFVLAPFTNIPSMLVLHAIAFPFLLLHWVTNADACFLTLVEKKLRGVDDGKSFFYNLVSPIYLLNGISDADLRQGVMLGSGVLWLVTVNKLLRDPSIWRRALFPSSVPEKPARADDAV